MPRSYPTNDSAQMFYCEKCLDNEFQCNNRWKRLNIKGKDGIFHQGAVEVIVSSIAWPSSVLNVCIDTRCERACWSDTMRVYVLCRRPYGKRKHPVSRQGDCLSIPPMYMLCSNSWPWWYSKNNPRCLSVHIHLTLTASLVCVSCGIDCTCTLVSHLVVYYTLYPCRPGCWSEW